MGYLGQLTNVLESGKVDVTYYYDSIGRMISRKDNYGHTLQMIYSNAMNPSEITHVYNFTSRQLHSLLYDDQGYIIALDNCKWIGLYVVRVVMGIGLTQGIWDLHIYQLLLSLCLNLGNYILGTLGKIKW